MSDKKFVYKVCLLGEANVGKTSLVYRFVKDMFKEDLASTIGVNISKKALDVDEYTGVSVQIWDLGGEDMFRSFRKTFLLGARGALLIYDMTSRETFEKVHEWQESFYNTMGEQPTVLIGNKSDLKKEIQVPKGEAKKYAKKNNLKLVITSAKTGDNVELAFKKLIRTIIEQSLKKAI